MQRLQELYKQGMFYNISLSCIKFMGLTKNAYTYTILSFFFCPWPTCTINHVRVTLPKLINFGN
jgi:hypothetical protein